ncbi:MAG: 50S ribosomal protein L9 [Gammaproteobacteria bacterium]
MNIILLEKVRKLGGVGEQVQVKPGYARNYLIPAGKAAFATADNIAKVAEQKEELEKAAQATLLAAQQRGEALQALQVSLAAQASEEGKLYGSIGVRELAEAITAAGIAVAKQEVRLPEGPIHYVGSYEIALQLHSDVTAIVAVTIVAE